MKGQESWIVVLAGISWCIASVGCSSLEPVRARELPREEVDERSYEIGKPFEGILIRPRLGQGTFRIAVSDAYGRACAITGEHSLPALEAAHIRPYSAGGDHRVSNGLLLRSDVHRLFDRGYVTVTPDLEFRVGERLRDDWQNGRTYYPLHGRKIEVPAESTERPDLEQLEWHRDRIFLG